MSSVSWDQPFKFEIKENMLYSKANFGKSSIRWLSFLVKAL